MRIKEQKSWTPPTPHPQNKTKVFGVESKILIKYKRIKWTPSGKATLLLPGGKSTLEGNFHFDMRNRTHPQL